MREGGPPEWGCMPELCPRRRPPTRAHAIFAPAAGREPATRRRGWGPGRRGGPPGGGAYVAARAVQRDWRYSMTRGTPKHLDRFRSVNTSGSGPAASTWPRRSSMAWVNPSGTSST
jgi:hypothetical protein